MVCLLWISHVGSGQQWQCNGKAWLIWDMRDGVGGISGGGGESVCDSGGYVSKILLRRYEVY